MANGANRQNNTIIMVLLVTLVVAVILIAVFLFGNQEEESDILIVPPEAPEQVEPGANGQNPPIQGTLLRPRPDSSSLTLRIR